MLSVQKRKQVEQAEWAEKLRRILKPGDTVDTVLRHVSRSGMSRRIDLYARTENGPMFITGMAAAAMGMRWDRNKGGIVVGGCGMDMGFHLVYNLSYTLWPKGFDCIGEGNRCPSNDHSNRVTPPDHACKGNGYCTDLECVPWLHKDGGYALRHNWL